MMFASVRPPPVQPLRFTFLVRDDPPEKLRGRVTLRERLGFFIRIIKSMIVSRA